MVNELGVVKVTSVYIVAASGLEFSFGVTAWTEMKIWYVEAKGTKKIRNITQALICVTTVPYLVYASP